MKRTEKAAKTGTAVTERESEKGLGLARLGVIFFTMQGGCYGVHHALFFNHTLRLWLNTFKVWFDVFSHIHQNIAKHTIT